MTHFAQILGSCLLVLCGAGCGLAAAAHRQNTLRELHTFAQFLRYLSGLLGTQALPGAELLHRAARCRDFAAFCPPGAQALSGIRLPANLPDALRQEITQTLTLAEESPRALACAALDRLAARCDAACTQREPQARTAQQLLPRLGACLGAVAAILLW